MKCLTLLFNRSSKSTQHHTSTKHMNIMSFCLLLMASLPAVAGSDMSFSSITDFVTNLLSGTGGMMLGLLALTIALIAALSGSLKFFLIVLAVIIGATLGPPIVMGFFTATF